MRRFTQASLALALLLGACKKDAPPPLYQAVPVVRKDIYVSAQASGAIEPILMVDVKSRASGTILEMRAQTGQTVRQGDTLVLVDKRDPTNTLNQAEADLAVAQAQLANAEATKRRTDAMFATQLVSEQEHEAANLTYANARAQLVRAQTSVQTARDAMDDTSVRAPVSGTIIAKNVEVGNVIASATRDVTGGVVLLKMADLSNVQIRTLVDETDIGKIYPGMQASITVDAYPNQPFTGTVLKVEPQSVVNQNVTMFPVLIQIPNEDGRLKPGMNTEVQVQVSQRNGVLAIPNAALRTPRDVSSAAMVLGLDPAQVQQTLARADSQAAKDAPAQANAGGGETAGSMSGSTPPVGGRPDGAAKADTTHRRGQGGQGAQSGQGGFQRGQGGQGRQGGQGGFQRGPGGQGGGQGGMGGGMPGGGFNGGGMRRGGTGGSYIVFAMRGGRPTPVRIRTGVTDLDYTEVVRGLTEQDTVLLLPSAGLLQSQQDMKDRFQRMTGGGVPGMKQQAAPTPSQGATQGGGGGAPRRSP